MFKVTPNPPDIDSVLYGDSLDPEKLKEAADRALKYYLNPGATKTQIPPPQAQHDLHHRRSGG